MFIFMVYKKTFSGVMYSSSFGVTLVALTMITTLAAGFIPLAAIGSVVKSKTVQKGSIELNLEIRMKGEVYKNVGIRGKGSYSMRIALSI